MLAESLEYLAIRPDGRYLDCTCGLGGHTAAIAERLTAGGKVISCDRDAQSLELARAEHGGVSRPHRIPPGEFFGDRRIESRRIDCGSGGEPLSAHQRGTRIFIYGRGAARHAHGPVAWHDGGRSAESQCREGNRRLAPPVRRRKESAEDSRSNRSGAAHSEHTAPGGCGGTGRSPDGTPASRDSHFHGPAHGCQSRAGGTRRAAGARAAHDEAGWAHRHHLLHVARGPQGQGKFPGAEAYGAGFDSDKEAAGARRAGSPGEPAVTQRKTAGGGNR